MNNSRHEKGIIAKFLDWVFPSSVLLQGPSDAPVISSSPPKELPAPKEEVPKELPAPKEEVPKVTPPAATQPPDKNPYTSCQAASSTTYKNGSTIIEVTKDMLVEDNSGLGSILPSMFHLTLPKELTSVISFSRRSMHVLESKCKDVKDFYAVVAAPVDVSMKTSAKVMAGLTVRAVFVAYGDKLMYRVEAIKASTSNPDMLEEEFCTYDISKLLAYCASDASASVTYY